MLTRRNFSLTSAAFAGLALTGCAGLFDKLQRIPDYRTAQMRRFNGYGPLVRDRSEPRLLDLPEGFCYRIISRFEDHMDDGLMVPDAADGMGAFALEGGRVALVRNHELDRGEAGRGAFRELGSQRPDRALAFDWLEGGPLPGGTTTIVYDYVNQSRERHYLSSAGTIRNCAGGVTPWLSWLTCEEDVSSAGGGLDENHGWVFEVPAGQPGLEAPRRLEGLGRFNHEAAAVHPNERIVYLTEDQIDGLFYRFVADRPRDLAGGGRLQALALAGDWHGVDSRNWSGTELRLGLKLPVRWITLQQGHSPDGDDLRERGHAAGATRFACGEGIHRGDGEYYFTCTSGGAIKSGQIMRYVPSPHEGEGEALERDAPATLELFLESTDPAAFNFGDNLTVAPNGHLIVCEDPYFGGEENYLFRPISTALGDAPPCYLRGVTPAGAVYDIARLHGGSELAGVCFAPDNRTMFVNVMSPTKTLAITGPWDWAGQVALQCPADAPPA